GKLPHCHRLKPPNSSSPSRSARRRQPHTPRLPSPRANQSCGGGVRLIRASRAGRAVLVPCPVGSGGGCSARSLVVRVERWWLVRAGANCVSWTTAGSDNGVNS
uniref:Uncharacterized protein n=1 Tax=Leersia perrieri TaxID=77586 RepID=A0A0D9VFP1_9ORYZ